MHRIFIINRHCYSPQCVELDILFPFKKRNASFRDCTRKLTTSTIQNCVSFAGYHCSPEYLYFVVAKLRIFMYVTPIVGILNALLFIVLERETNGPGTSRTFRNPSFSPNRGRKTSLLSGTATLKRDLIHHATDRPYSIADMKKRKQRTLRSIQSPLLGLK